MKKISTVQASEKEILKEQKLTIGVDLGDRWSFYCVLDEAGKITLRTESADDTGSAEADIFEDTAKSHRTADRNTFAMGKPAVNGVGLGLVQYGDVGVGVLPEGEKI
jgi:predicted NBD/HSP70 family sugar kinase